MYCGYGACGAVVLWGLWCCGAVGPVGLILPALPGVPPLGSSPGFLPGVPPRVSSPGFLPGVPPGAMGPSGPIRFNTCNTLALPTHCLLIIIHGILISYVLSHYPCYLINPIKHKKASTNLLTFGAGLYFLFYM